MEYLFTIFIKVLGFLRYGINKTSYADFIASLAMLTALGALAWNIVRDLLLDKAAIGFSVAFGEVGNIKNSKTGVFADAGSLIPNHIFDNPSILVQITNIGRRPIGVASIGGEFRNGQGLYMAVDGLPKMLQPYEIFSSTSNTKTNFLEKIQKDEIKNLWVIDTKGKKWLLSAKGWERLKNTANYIATNKHIS